MKLQKRPDREPWIERLRRRFGEHAVPVAWALGINAALLLGAGFVVVARALRAPEPEFQAALSMALPQEPWEQEYAWGEADAGASSESPLERISVDSLLPSGPVLPESVGLPSSDLASADLLGAAADGFLAQAGFAGMLAGANSAASAASFFGIEDSGERIVLIVNTSASVVRKAKRRGVTVERLQEEAARLVEGMAGRSLFGLVQFSQGVRLFAPHLAPATANNKQALRQWMQAELRGNPPVADDARVTGHEAALAAAWALEPDVVFLVTDGQLERRAGAPGAWTYPRISAEALLHAARELQRKSPRATRLHVVGFEMSASDAEGMRRLAEAYGGQVRAF